MKHIFLLPICLAAGLTMYAQATMDLRTASYLEKLNESPISRYAEQPSAVTMIVRASTNNLPGEILASTDDYKVVSVAVADIPQLIATEGVERVNAPRRRHKLLQKARKAAGIDDVHNAVELARAYTGKDVIVGIIDQGMDPNHIAFLNADGTASRVCRFYNATTNSWNNIAGATEYATPEAIAAFTTDDRSEYHGTHVSNIAAGENAGNDFQGVAPGADIVMVGCDFYDGSILLGIQKIIDYAKSVGKPCVINMSLGDNVGPHDGSEDFSRAISEYGKDAIISIAAGNEGEYAIATKFEVKSEDDVFRTIIFPQDYYSSYGNFVEASMEFWGADDTPFSVSVLLIDPRSGELLATLGNLDHSTNGRSTTLRNTIFNKYFTQKSFSFSSDVDANNNRYNFYCDINAEGRSTNTSFTNPTAVIAFEIKGTPGQVIYGYCDGYYNELVNLGLDGFTAGIYDGTINSMGCGDNIITVGSYNTATSVALSSGKNEILDGVVGEVSTFSSYGTLLDGRQLPTVCAPGHTIISAVNHYYTGQITNVMGGSKKVGTTNYRYTCDSGTSMSTPFATGVFALWLEADPTLTYDGIIDVINRTSLRDKFVEKGNPVQWGAGKIDAMAGLKYILNITGVSDVNADTDRISVSANGTGWEVFAPGSSEIDVEVYTMAGVQMLTHKSAGDTATIDASGLLHGIYLLRVNGTTLKVAI